MRNHLVWALLTFISVAQPVRADDWKLISSARGIDVYRRDVAGSAIVAFKGVGAIEAPLWKVASILLDTRRAPEWVRDLKESRVVRRLGLNSYIEYNHFGLPFILKDRDFVSQVLIEVDPQSKVFALRYETTDDPSVPATNHVRGEIISGSIRATSIEKERRTSLTAEIHCDLKGSIPKWFMNFTQKDWPRDTFESIRGQAAKENITIPDEFRDILAATQRF